MSIDAIIYDTIRNGDGTETLLLQDPAPNRCRGQNSLIVVNPPKCGLSGLIGCHIWGNNRDIMFKTYLLGHRLGYGKVWLNTDIATTVDGVEATERTLGFYPPTDRGAS